MSTKSSCRVRPHCCSRFDVSAACRYCVEYDLAASSVAAGVVCVKSVNPGTTTVCSHRIELAAKPTAVMWHPKIDGDFEDRFVVANDAFKLKEFNLDSKQCRRTSLAPMFGNPPVALVPIPPAFSEQEATEANAQPPSSSDPLPGEALLHHGDGEAEAKAPETVEGTEAIESSDGVSPEPTKPAAPVPEYFAFSTGSRVVGVSSFPLTGDPSQVAPQWFLIPFLPR